MNANPPVPRHSPKIVALVVGFSCLAALAEGFEMQAPGVTLPVLSKVFGLTSGDGVVSGFLSQRSLFLSIGIFGLILGSVGGGLATDKLGHKWVAVGSVAIFGIFSILTAYAPDARFLLAWRLLTGVGLGGALPALLTVIGETVSAERRSTAIGVFHSTMPLGGVLVGLVSIQLATPTEWPMIYVIGGIIPLLAAVGLAAVLPARSKFPVNTIEAADGPRSSGRFLLFADGRAWITTALWVAYVCLMVQSAILLGWMPVLLHGGGLRIEDAFLAQIGFNVSAVLGYIAAGVMMDRWSRRATVPLVFTLAAASLAYLANAPAQLGFVIAGTCMVGMAMSAAGTILYTLALGAYPPELRGRGVGYAVAVGRFGSALGPLIGGAMLGAGLHPMSVLLALIPLVLLAGIAAHFVNSRDLAAARQVMADNLRA